MREGFLEELKHEQLWNNDDVKEGCTQRPVFRASGPKEPGKSRPPFYSTSCKCYWGMQYSRRSQRRQERSCRSPDCLRKTIFKKEEFSPSKARTENSPCLLLTWLTSFNKLIFYLSDEKQKIESVSPVFPLGCYPLIQQTFALCPAGREAKVPWATPITTGLRQRFTWWLAPVSDDNGLESARCTKHKYPNNSFPGNKDWGVGGMAPTTSLGWRFRVLKRKLWDIPLPSKN